MYDQRNNDTDSLQWLEARMEMLRRLELEEVEEENYWFKDAEPQTLQNKAIAQTPDSSAVLKAADPGTATTSTNSEATVNQTAPKKAEETKNAQPVKEQKKTNTGTAKKQTGQKQKSAEVKKTETKSKDTPQKTEPTLSAPTSLTNISYADIKPEGRGKSEEYYSNYYLGMLRDSKKATDNNIKKQTAEPTGGVPYWLRLLGDKRQNVNEAVVNRLFELKDLGGWDALLLSSADPNPLISSAAKAGLRRLSLKYPEFKEYILTSANDHSSALGDYAIKFLMETNNTEGIDKPAFVSTLKSKLDFCKEEVQRIYENDHNAVIDSFNLFIGQVIKGSKANHIKAVEQLTLAELIETDQKTEVIMTQLHLARQVAETLRPMIKEHFRQNKGASQMNERAVEMWSQLKLGLMRLPLIYLPDKQNEYKKGSAQLHNLFSKNTVQELSTASVGDFETQINLLLWQALQLKNSPAFEEEGGKSNINMALLRDCLADNLQQLQGIQKGLPQIKAAAKSNPHVYFEFLNQSQGSISTVTAKLTAASVTLNLAAAVGGLRRFGLKEINKGLSPFSAEAKKRVAEYNSSSKQLEEAGIAALNLASGEKMNGAEIANDLLKIKQGKGLQTSLTFAQSVGAINEGIANGLEVAQHFLFEVVLTLVTIMSAGLLTEVTAPLLFIEIAETASALARVSSGIINFGTRLGIETLTFTVINKSLTSATGGEANWQDFGHDYLKNLLTFGALKATGAAYSSATDEIVTMTKFGKFLKGTAGFTLEAATLQGLDYLDYLYENSQLKDEDKKEYEFGERVLNNMAFLAGIKLGIAGLKLIPGTKLHEQAKIEKIEQIDKELNQVLKNINIAELNAETQQRFLSDIVRLVKVKTKIYQNFAKSKDNAEAMEYYKQINAAITNRISEVSEMALDTFKIKESPSNPNVVYFEGDATALRSLLKLPKGASFKQKKEPNTWILKTKDGKETTYINKKPSKIRTAEEVLKDKQEKSKSSKPEKMPDPLTIRTIEEAEDWAVNYLGVENALYHGCDLEVANQMNKTWFELMNKYEHVKLKKILFNESFLKRSIYSDEPETTLQIFLGDIFEFGKFAKVDKIKFYSEKDKLGRMSDTKKRSSQHLSNIELSNYLNRLDFEIRHEFGHQIQRKIANEALNGDKKSLGLMEKFKNIWESLSLETKLYISAYGSKNKTTENKHMYQPEAFAECFALYESGKGMEVFPVELYNYFNQEIIPTITH